MTLHEKAKKMELEILLNQYDYIKKELKAKEEYTSVINSIFETGIVELLEKNETLKLQWNSLVKKNDNTINNLVSTTASKFKAVSEKHVTQHTLLEKELFRNIAKETHPDKFKDADNSRTDIYIQASEAYESRDLAGLLLASTKCGIHFELTNDVLELMVILYEKVEKSMDRVAFITTTIPWKWYHAPASIQEEVLLTYIESRLD